MFWSARSRQWELPSAKQEDHEIILTQYPCPVCQKPLEQYDYVKEGQPKKLLRCSDSKMRALKNHKDAVYFFSQGRWWSPKFGEITNTPSDESP